MESSPPQGAEPIGQVQPAAPTPRLKDLHPGIVMRVRGRTIRLRGLRTQPTGILFWLSILGPGLISGAVSNDPGSIATYSQAGAQYGYDLLWLVLPITVALIVAQEMSARLGAATGRGLMGLIRTQFGIGWAMLATLTVIVANFGLVLGEFLGISSAMQIFGVSKFISVPIAAALICFLVLAGSYQRVEKVFMVMAAVFLTYPVAAILSHPSLPDVLRGALIPTVHLDPAYLAMGIGLIGTTISPYQQIFEQSAIVEKGIPRRHYGPERWDTAAGMVFSSLVIISILIATAATLHGSGNTQINTAADAAKALEPVVGNAAGALFAIGIIGAGLMAAVVVALSTSFAFTGAFGFLEGFSLDVRHAPIFYGLFLGQVIVAAALSMLLSGSAFQFLVDVQILNGFLLPIVLVFMLLLVNNPILMGNLKNSRLANILGWGTVALITSAIVIEIISQVLSAWGVHLLGS